MRNKKIIACCMMAVVLSVSACSKKAEVSEKSSSESLIEAEVTQDPVKPADDVMESGIRYVSNYELNDGYKLFYGTWRYAEIVSEHVRLGGDPGYQEVIGQTITYDPDYFETELGRIVNPKYLISIYPIYQDNHNGFFAEQIGIEKLLPNHEFFVLVQVVDTPIGIDIGDLGKTFILDDDNTIYEFDRNCIYKLERIAYIDGYDAESLPSYQER